MRARRLYDPSPARGGAPLDKRRLHRGGSYIFQNFPAPASGLIVIVVGDADGRRHLHQPRHRRPDVANGNKYRVDAYVLPRRSPTAGSAGGFDIAAGGAYVAKFYSDTKPTPTPSSSPTRRTPVCGVQLTEDGAVAGRRQVLRHLADGDRSAR